MEYLRPDLPLDGFEGPRPPPLPVLRESDAPAAVHSGTVDYYRPERIEIDHWVEVTRCSTVAQWHQSRAALGRGQIPSIMGDGEDLTPAEREAGASGGIALLVPERQANRAKIILQARQSGREWCPRCGSMSLKILPLPWWWMFYSILFLGVPPFSPPRFDCRDCGHRWE